MKACEVCGREFEAKRITARFCSSTCRSRFHRGAETSVATLNANATLSLSQSPEVEKKLDKVINLLEMLVTQQSTHSAAPRQTIKMTIPDNVDIEISKAEGGGAAVTQNYLNSLFAMTGAQVTVAPPEPAKTIKLNGVEVEKSTGIKKMEVPQFDPPTFDDEL